MEALANRAGILVNGELACLGSVAHLRSVHGQGYLLEVKLGDASSARLDETVRRAAAFLTHNHGEPAGTATATAAAAATKAATPLPWLIRGALGPLVAHLGGDAAAVEASMKPAGAGRGAPRGDEGGPSPSGSALSAAFDTGGGGGGGRISLPLFAAWWEGEAAVGALLAFVLRGAEGPPCLRGARLEEQQGSCLRFRVPPAAPAAAESAADVGAKQQRRVGVVAWPPSLPCWRQTKQHWAWRATVSARRLWRLSLTPSRRPLRPRGRTDAVTLQLHVH